MSPQKGVDPSRARRWLRAFALLGSCVALAALQQSLLQLAMPLYGGALLLIIAVVWAFSPPQPGSAETAPLARYAALLGIGLAIFFRTRFIWAVPSGWGFEALTFVFFARRLVEEGFPYIPYAWYAHTLYSYAIAVALAVTGNELAALRIAAATISSLTVACIYFAGRCLFGRQLAWIVVLLAASSWWHMWSTRNGYHQFVMPLFQTLFVTGVVVGFRDGKRWAFLLAALSLAGALHAYWGLYLLLPYGAAIVLYILIFHFDMWRAQWRNFGAAALLAVVASLPLIWFFAHQTELFGYATSAFAPAKSDAANLAEKIANNARYIFWALSGHPNAPVPWGSLVDPLLTSSAIVGLILSVKWSRRSLPHAAIVLLFLVNVGGLLFTMANSFYIVATMAAFFLFAAVALDAVMTAWSAALPRLRSAIAFAVIGLLLWHAHQDYETFFYKRAASDLQSPLNTIGSAFALLDRIAISAERSTLFVPRFEPGRDFGEEIFELGARVDTYAFMRQVRELDARSILFPRSQLRAEGDLQLFYPKSPYVERRTLPILRRIYPQLQVSREEPPEPYRSFTKPVAIRITIPWEAARAHFGLVRDAADSERAHGFFFAPSDGAYLFRSTHTDLDLQIDDVRVATRDPLYLERGLHRINVSGWSDPSPVVEFQSGSETWQPLDAHLVNAGAAALVDLQPYLARPGRLAEFYFERRSVLRVPGTIRDALVSNSGDVTGFSVNDLTVFGPHGEVRWRIDLPGPLDFRGVRVGTQMYAIAPNGRLYEVSEQGSSQRQDFGCGVADVAWRDTNVVALCFGAELRQLDGSMAPLSLRDADGEPLLRPVSMRLYKGAFVVVDSLLSELLTYDLQGHLLERRVMPHLWVDSDLAVDAEDNLYVRCWHDGWRAYAADGALLFHPDLQKPVVFSVGEMALPNVDARRLSLLGEHGSFIAAEGRIDLYERRLAK